MPITYEQTTDHEFITRCVTHPSVWRMGSDDGMTGIDPKLFFVKTDNRFWLKAGDYGVFACEPRNLINHDVHIALLPEARGRAVEICRGGINWMFNNTKCIKITASIPEYNRLAISLANKVGMQIMGINKKSFLKNGEVFDQLMFGISKE